MVRYRTRYDSLCKIKRIVAGCFGNFKKTGNQKGRSLNQVILPDRAESMNIQQYEFS